MPISRSLGPALELCFGLQIVPSLTPSVVFQSPPLEVGGFVHEHRGGREHILTRSRSDALPGMYHCSRRQ
jgi:hypothetical protein